MATANARAPVAGAGLVGPGRMLAGVDPVVAGLLLRLAGMQHRQQYPGRPWREDQEQGGKPGGTEEARHQGEEGSEASAAGRAAGVARARGRSRATSRRIRAPAARRGSVRSRFTSQRKCSTPSAAAT